MEPPSTPSRTPRGTPSGGSAMTSAASPFAQSESESPRMRASTLAYGARTRNPPSVSSPPSAKAPSAPRTAPRTPQMQQLPVMPPAGPATPLAMESGPGPVADPGAAKAAPDPAAANLLGSASATPRTPVRAPSRGHQRVPSSSYRSAPPSAYAGHQRSHSGHSVTHSRTPSSASYMRALDHGAPAHSPSTPGAASNAANVANGGSSAAQFGATPATTTPVAGSIPAPLPSSHSHRKPQKRTSIGPWDFVKSIGAGSMGQVKLAVHRYTKQMAAVKIVPKAFTQKNRDGRESIEAKDARVVREAAIGRLLEHPNISKLYDVYSMTGHFYLVFEYIAGGQMLDYIIAHGCVKENQARRFARSIASALDYCHHNSVVHRDLKIENILIADDGDIRLIDFGLSNLFRRDDLLRTFCGSLYFAAPELLNAMPYVGPEIDVWSFGVVLYVLVCGKVPFEDKSMTVLHAKIKRGTVDYPQWLSSLCVDLLSRMLTVNSGERATLAEVMRHPWMLKGYDSPPESHVPRRFPLTVDSLDPQVIEEMESLGIGDAYNIDRSLRSILGSAEYQAALDNWYDSHEADLAANDSSGSGSGYVSIELSTRSSGTNLNLDSRIPSPLDSFSPEISCYFLTRERLLQSRAIKVPHDGSRDHSAAALAQPPPAKPAITVDSQPNGNVPKSSTPAPEPQQAVLLTPKQPSAPKTAISSPEPDIKSGRLRSKTLGAAYDMPSNLAFPPSARTAAPPVRDAPQPAEVPQPAYVSNIPQQAQVGLVTPMTAVKPIDLDNASSPRRNPSRIVSQPIPQSHLQQQQQQQQQQQTLSLFRRFSLRRKPAGHGRAKSTSHAVPSNFDATPKGHSEASQQSLASMPSIESPKPVFFRGIFSVQSTSTKPLREIRAELIRVLSEKHIEFVEVCGGFACVARPHFLLQQMTHQHGYQSSSHHQQLAQPAQGPPQLRRASSSSSSVYAPHYDNHSSQSSHSSGTGLAGNLHQGGGSGGVGEVVRTPSSQRANHGELLVPPSPQTPPSTPKHRRKVSENGVVSPAVSAGGSTDSIDMEIGASDMLGESKQKSSIPVRFEISIVRVPIVSLHGIQFKKMTGNVWQYKNIAQEILEDLRI